MVAWSALSCCGKALANPPPPPPPPRAAPPARAGGACGGGVCAVTTIAALNKAMANKAIPFPTNFPIDKLPPQVPRTLGLLRYQKKGRRRIGGGYEMVRLSNS